MTCAKRRYDSVEQARKAHRRFGGRIRVYRCPECRGYHVTANEKRENIRP
jgi:hypothetical protein